MICSITYTNNLQKIIHHSEKTMETRIITKNIFNKNEKTCKDVKTQKKILVTFNSLADCYTNN